MYVSYGKRALDIVLTLTIAMPAALLCLGCLLAIKFEAAGPGIFRQVRVGRHRQPFVLYKLRTMATGTGDRPSHEISPARITRVGRFLRRTKLDELPQLLNVLNGDISLVGPRPCLPSQTRLVVLRDNLGIYNVRPGITGPAQVAGLDMSDPIKLAAMDARYVDAISLGHDLKYLILTLLGRGSGDAACGRVRSPARNPDGSDAL